MQSSFKIAFNVAVTHTYFDKGVCNCLQFVPDAGTQMLLKRFGFIIRNKINGFELYSNSTSELSALLNHISKVTGQNSFGFKIQTNNPSFNYFTDLPVSWRGQLVYDSQSIIAVSDSNVVLLKETQSEDTDTTCIGSLNVQFDDLLKYSNATGFAQFQINYTARSTQWQYYVINKSALALGNPAIVGKADISFSPPTNVTIDSGQQAMMFSSGNNLIPLSEVPQYKFDLVNNPASGGNESSAKSTSVKTIFKGLPNPDPKRIGIVSIDNQQQISSPMYVYV
ncbi:hypothetical protein [Mucilaginibacter jinjuensis]|uniref:Uncharacterized protein n=1 Tax=Mucilaginibacter jinjuensis TaxID=1176721 RepID=A0ABY7T2G8_9SPHI|nr:hypothetical protein [Mucilaginibacter jinjuensis]WCT10013.1 hypothetical protein PQO05_14870 [Mucilaginibacter jinjuensis]